MLRMIFIKGDKTLIKGKRLHRSGASVCTGTLWHEQGRVEGGCARMFPLLVCVCVCVSHQPQPHNLAFVMNPDIVLVMQKERPCAIKY